MKQNLTLPRMIQTTASASDDLPDLLRRFGYHVPLLVTDRVTAELGIAAPFCQRLEQHQILHDLFYDLEPKTSLHNAIAGAHKVLAGCSSLYPDPFDCIVALGGTSVIEVAKGISVAATNGGSLQRPRQKRAGLPIIAIPTTDSVSEVTDHATLMNNGHLISISDTAPVAILLDSELIGDMTSMISRTTALSTLSYALDAVASPNASLFSDQQAQASLRLLRQNITSAMASSHCSESRQAMTLAARQAGIAFNATGGGLLHHMSQIMSLSFEIDQPICRTLLLAPVTEYQATISPEPYALCATTLGLTQPGDTLGDAVLALERYINTLHSNAQLPGLSSFVSCQSRYMGQIDAMSEDVCAVLNATEGTVSLPATEIRQLFQALWR